MSEIKVNNITSYEGSSGPVLSGITTVSSTSFMTLPRGDTAYRGGRGRGIFGGGLVSPSYTNIIDYVTIASTGDAVDFGDLTAARSRLSGTSNSLRGLFSAGLTPAATDIIDYITITTTGDAVDFGNLIAATFGLAACSDSHGGLG